jgi:small subunit ribosomal protein S14
MAKKAWMERNKRKAGTVKKYAAQRAELKAKRDYIGLAKSAQVWCITPHVS